jgi:N-acetylglucosamine malate deacetylase 1
MHNKLDILVLAAHPDDAELGCAGTILAHVALGYKVGIIDFTHGELGTRGSGPLRLLEAQAAATILGLSARENMGFRDGFFENDERHQMALVQIIRKYQPTLVLANAPKDRHPDHSKGASIATKACFLAGLQKIETLDTTGIKQKAWRPQNVWHYIQDQHISPDIVTDITAYWPQKLEAIKAFKSQFFDADSLEPASYISSKDFWHFLEARAREMGHPMGFTYGEGFIKSRAFGVKNLFDLA